MSTNLNKNNNHTYFMRLALEQAKKVLGNTKNNPAVGCVITKNNHVISAGYTSINGRPHAEHNAIKLSNTDPINSQLYVTLEPCSHYGKTPPCTNSIIKKKINKVFFAINDPDPRSFNKSSNQLVKKGIYVKKGILRKEIKSFYRSYLKNKKSDLPFVTCKLAISRDYYAINKKNKNITNKFSRGRAHLMRSYHDCLITSSKTIIDDNPRLTCRIKGLQNRSPSRIILDNELKIPISSRIIKESFHFPTIIFYNKNNKAKMRLLKKLKVKIYKIPLDIHGDLDLKKSLLRAKELGYSRIFLESGIKLISNFLSQNLIDEFKLFISDTNLGNNGDANFKKYYRLFLNEKKNIIEKVNLLGDRLLTYKLR